MLFTSACGVYIFITWGGANFCLHMIELIAKGVMACTTLEHLSALPNDDWYFATCTLGPYSPSNTYRRLFLPLLTCFQLLILPLISIQLFFASINTRTDHSFQRCPHRMLDVPRATAMIFSHVVSIFCSTRNLFHYMGHARAHVYPCLHLRLIPNFCLANHLFHMLLAV